MPTYDYRCNGCSHEFEQFQSMSDKPLRTCPACGKKTLERLIGIGAAVLFKGSGFYQTDYRSESYKKAAEADTKPASTDAKPAAESTKPADAPKPEAAATPTPDKSTGATPSVSRSRATKPTTKPVKNAGPRAGAKRRAARK